MNMYTSSLALSLSLVSTTPISNKHLHVDKKKKKHHNIQSMILCGHPPLLFLKYL